MKKKMQMGRLALRVEGDFWNAYIAAPESMEGAVFMGSIPMAFVANKPERKEAFMNLMKACFDDFIQENIGQLPTWGEPKVAPEKDRTGNA